MTLSISCRDENANALMFSTPRKYKSINLILVNTYHGRSCNVENTQSIVSQAVSRVECTTTKQSDCHSQSYEWILSNGYMSVVNCMHCRKTYRDGLTITFGAQRQSCILHIIWAQHPMCHNSGKLSTSKLEFISRGLREPCAHNKKDPLSSALHQKESTHGSQCTMSPTTANSAECDCS